MSVEPERRKRRAAALLGLSLLLATTATMAIEEPDHAVVRTIGEIEIRDYPSYAVAEVEVAGGADDAGGKAFPILAGYISGKNNGQRKLEMTAPVVQTDAPVRLPMTAPVTQAAVPGGQVVQFVLPKGVTVATAPEPTDPRVRVRTEAARRYAVIRYSGLWSEANYDLHLRRLEDGLAAAGLKPTGGPLFARYDPPFKPWFMRRNEIWLPIASP